MFLISKDENDYQAIKYLVSSKDKKIQFLPQYVDSLVNLESLAIILRERKNELSNEIDKWSIEFDNKYINKKYYDIFTSNNIYISDPEEFSIFLSKIDLTSEDKINILKDVINYNLVYYHNNYDSNSDEISEFINNHKGYLLNEYVSYADNINKYFDLSLDLPKIIDLCDEKEYCYSNILLAKKIWLVNKIYNEYQKGNKDLDEFIDEYKLIISIENNNDEEIKRMIKEGC